MGKSPGLYLLCVALLVAGLAVGFLVGKGGLSKVGTSPLVSLDNDSDLYTTQTATIRGKITKVNGDKLTVINSNNIEGEVETDDRIIITKLSLNPKAPSASSASDLKTLELNKEVNISLELSGNKYRAVLIQYLPALPPLPKSTATNSGQKR